MNAADSISSTGPLLKRSSKKWAVGKLPNPSPLGTSNKSSGYFRSRDYLLRDLITNRTIPEGQDIGGNPEALLPIDFNEILKGLSLPK
jgi:hypothetical protein